MSGLLKTMYFKRQKSIPSKAKENELTIVEFAKMLFGPFCEGFVIAGYGRVTHLKFLLMHGTSSVYQDAFEQCRGPFSNWINSESEQFPDHEFKQVRIPVKSGKETEGVNDLDNAVKRFSLASDAFLLFGYSKEHRVIKTFAGDPLKADAVMYLQLMAMDLWGGRKEA